MALPIIPALVAIGQAGYQMYQSEKQKSEAADLKPSNYVPPALKEAETTSRMNANAIPAGYARGLERIQKTTATSIDAAKRLGAPAPQLQQTVADVDAREKELTKDLEVSVGAARENNRSQLINVLSMKGQFEKMSNDAYSAAVSALTGASKQNQFNAISGLGENLIAAEGLDRQQKMFTELFKLNK